MKKSVLTLMCVATLMACKKNETTSTESNTDSSAMEMPADTMMTTDSATVSASEGTANLSDQDKVFADDAAKGGMMEVMLGQLAAQNGANSRVKAFGDMMVKDHTKANDELKSWATGAGYTLPANADAAQQKMHDDLKNKKGAEFDRAYMDMMVQHHTETIEKFRKQNTGGSDQTLTQWAGKTLPTLEAHLTQAKEIQTAVK